MGDFDNLTREMARRERNHAEVRALADLPPIPPNYARIAVLQTERAWLRAELDKAGASLHGTTPAVLRYCAIDKEIREALT